jgi:hypothetical protein
MPPTWPPGVWSDAQLKALGEFVMKTTNPYQRSAPIPRWQDKCTLDAGTNMWSFRGTAVRVERAVEIPYLIWYPRKDVAQPAEGNPADWILVNEKLLVGYVGAGGW